MERDYEEIFQKVLDYEQTLHEKNRKRRHSHAFLCRNRTFIDWFEYVYWWSDTHFELSMEQETLLI